MASVFVGIALFEYRHSYNERVHIHEKNLAYLVNTEFQKLTQTYTSRLTGFIFSNKDIIHHFERRERAELITATEPRFITFKKENPDFHDMTFILPDGTLFLSMADTSKYGVNLSAHPYLQSLMKETNAVRGFVISNGMLFFQVAQNVIIDGKRLGTLEFKIHTDALNDTIQEVLGAEYGVAAIKKSNSILETNITEMSSRLFQELPLGFDFNKKSQNLDIGQSSYIININPIKDFNGSQIGYYLTSNDITAIRNRFQQFFLYVVLITVAVIILSAFVLYIGFGTIIKKIENINTNLENTIEQRTKELSKAKEKTEQQNMVINSLYKRFRSMFQNHHSIMFLIDPETGQVVEGNSAAANLLNIEIKALSNINIFDLSLLPKSDAKRILTQAEANGLHNYISKFKINDQLIDLEIQASPIEIEGIRLLFTICYDVTEKMRIANELKELNKTLENKVKEEIEKQRQQELLLIQQSKMSSVGEILSAIIHQWKQPITALSYLLQDLSDSAIRGSADNSFIQSTANEALSQINYMTNTVEDFRRFLTPSKTKDKFNVATSVIKTINMLNKQIEKDNIGLNLTIINAQTDVSTFNLSELVNLETDKTDLGCFLSYGYQNEFQQVLMNIINNARDAINADERKNNTDGQINIVISCLKEMIEISVADNAGGIPSNIIDKIFEPYFTTKSQKGTGIGLYMAKNIIENHMNGTIAVSDNDKGAIFTILLKRSDC